MRIQGHDGTGTKRAPHDQVGGAAHTDRLDVFARHRVALYGEPQLFKQLSRPQCGLRAVPRRIVRRQLDEFAEKGDLARMMRIDPAREAFRRHA